MDVFRYIASLFGARFVVLIDFDGERSIRMVKFAGGRPFASRYGFGIRDVWLLDQGMVGNGKYVDSWEIYEPLAARRWPTPPEAA